MTDQRSMTEVVRSPARAATPTWRVVCFRELRDLWIGGTALYLILIYTVLLGIYAFILASNVETKVLPLKEMMLEMVKASIGVGLLICLIIGADSVSGERERVTLEGLLLTPASRRQLVAGKLLAAVSPWPVALAIVVPYWAVLSKGDPVFGQAVLWSVLLGSLLALAVAGIGMLISALCASNKSSLLVSLGFFLLLWLPTELARPSKTIGIAESGRAALYRWVNPWDAAAEFLVRIMLYGSHPSEVWHLLILPVLLPIVVLVLLFGSAGRRLRLDPGMGRNFRAYWSRLPRVVTAPAWGTARRESASVFGAAARPEPLRRAPELDPTSRPRRKENSRVEPAGPAAPSWWLVCRKELHDLWVGGKALNLTIAYLVLMGVYSWLMARDSAQGLVYPKELVYEMLKSALVVAVFMGVIIGADSLSGERERVTLEGLLLTPASRRQIVFGKFLAAISPWPVALAITIPYLKMLSQGDPVFEQAVLWGTLLGSIGVLSFTALGMLIGFFCNSNRTSLFVTLCLYLLFLLPTQWSGLAQNGFMGHLFQGVNPMQAPRHFLAKILANNRTLDEMWPYLISPVVSGAIVFGLLFWYASPGLRLEAGRQRRSQHRRIAAAVVGLIASLLAFGAGPAIAHSQETPTAAPSATSQQPVEVSIDVTAKTVRAGTPIDYTTVVTNNGSTTSPPLIAAMNLINLNKQGDVVDPEDWSPQRTQYLDSLPPGQSANLAWRVNAILDGDFMVYMVVIPAPGAAENTSHPVTSPGMHLTVTRYTRLNPGGVLPYAIGGPVLLGLLIFVVYRHRRRQIDTGGPA